MPSYRLRHDFFNLPAGMTIADSEGIDRFRAEGAWLTNGVTLTDLASGDALELRPKGFALKTLWQVQRDGEVLATFESAGWLTQTYTLDVPGPNDFTVQQTSLLGFDVVVTRPVDGQVARVYRPEWLTTDLAIDVEPGQDDLLIVACVSILLYLRQQA